MCLVEVGRLVLDDLQRDGHGACAPRPLVAPHHLPEGPVPEALEDLLSFCREATVWFDMRRRYLGAYLSEGFRPPVLQRLVQQLRQLLPDVIGDLPLSQFWAYKYDSSNPAGGGEGIKIHADPASVNLNVWLTPDSANLDPESGGLVIYEEVPTDGMSFDEL